ncbi:MAG: hypothetical protein KKB30_04000 [Proteobacteria bacterium]|nr:hypothetical protein [Pseudomonadota bacterium]MBU1717265.1 hypothetical protein [Pseudomonadota bacterium]
MRYIFSILLIAVVFTIITSGFYIYQHKNPETNPALIINGRVISTPEFNQICRSRPHDQTNREEYIDSLITRELLIQEAMKMKLEQEEDFRRSLQNFYEQSLTKILLERKYDSFKSTPSPPEIARFLELQEYRVEMTLLPVSTQAGEEKEYDEPCRNLASAMQVALIPLTPGAESEPILINNFKYRIRLNQLRKIPSADASDISAEEARETIISERQEQALNRWLYDLRDQASVMVAASIKNEKKSGNPPQNGEPHERY